LHTFTGSSCLPFLSFLRYLYYIIHPIGELPMSASSPVSNASTYPASKIAIAYVIAVALSFIASLVIRWIGDIFVEAPADLAPFNTWIPLLLDNVVYIGIAALIWAFIARRSQNPLSTWNKVVIIGFVLSFIPNVIAMVGPQPSFAGTFTWPTMAVISLMHVAAAVITWWALPRFSRV
jgi:hypothetical protein